MIVRLSITDWWNLKPRHAAAVFTIRFLCFRLRADMDDGLTAKELTQLFADPHWAERFPPILSVDQAAELLQVPKQTIYDWSSRGLLHGCKAKVGKYLRLFRDRLVQKTYHGDFHAQ